MNRRTSLLTLALLAAVAVGCNAAASVDQSNPEAIAELYAIADHQHDHEALYDLVHPTRRGGAALDEWVAEQEQLIAEGRSRYPTDRGHARTAQPREVDEVDVVESSAPTTSPEVVALDVIVSFADGQREVFVYGFIETQAGWVVDGTENR